jgi:hypothetical protein
MRSRTYNFIDKDPCCGELMDLVDRVGLRGPKNVGKVATLAGVAYGTADGILYGDTKKPRNDTVMKIGTALGFSREWVQSDKKWELMSELEKAREWNKSERERMKKEREKTATKKKRKAKARKKPNLRLVKSA